jgi:drug/metabolite transporter, DME family
VTGGGRAGFAPYLLVLGAALCWATIGPAYALILRGVAVSPLTVVVIRVGAAALALGLGLLVARRDLLIVRRRELPLLALLGIVCVSVTYPAMIYAYELTSVAVSTILLYLAPAFVTLVSIRTFGEPLTARKGLALTLCLLGAILTVEPWRGEALRGSAPGFALALLGALAYGAYSLLGKVAAGRHRPATILFYLHAFGFLGLVPAQLFGGSALPGGATLALIALVTGVGLSVVPLGLYTVALSRLPAGNAAIVATLEPAFAIGLAALILGQFLAPAQLLGAALIIGGVVVLATGGH